MSGRNRLKAVVDSPWAMPLRGALLIKQVAAEQKKVKEIAKELNLPLFSRNCVRFFSRNKCLGLTRFRPKRLLV